MNLLSDLMPWLMWLIGIVGVGGAIALAWFLPGFVTVVAEFLRPWARLAGDFLTGWLRALWEGTLDIVDNYKTVITVVTVGAIAFGAGYNTKSYNTKDVADSVRAEYKLVKRTSAEKKAYLKKTGNCQWYKGCF